MKQKIVAVNQKKQKTKTNLALLKVDYEGGIMTRAEIAEKHGINKSTLYRHAVNNTWQFGKNQEKALTAMQTAMVRRLGERRAEVNDQHLVELNEIKEDLFKATEIKEVKILSDKTEALLKIIRGERLALGLPSDYKYVEQKNETTFKVEDALRELDTINGDYTEVSDDASLPA
tara:strand:- start:4503 stop:5024 length:522 start_codon:yes stop_codon:yes gene_type:complete